MTEFDIIKTALERIGDKLEITEWELLGEQQIEDITTQITYDFKNKQLEYVWNDRHE